MTDRHAAQAAPFSDPQRASDEDDRFLAICRGEEGPDLVHYQAGWDAHADGLAFHVCPYDFDTVEALSWRIGWNDRALHQDRTARSPDPAME